MSADSKTNKLMMTFALNAVGLVLLGCASAAPTGGPVQARSADGPFIRPVSHPVLPSAGELIISGDFSADAPRYSPDGTRIAFTARRSGGRTDVAVVPAIGGEPVFVTSGGTNFHPAWSPDGNRLVYISQSSGQADLFVVSFLGGEAVRITHSSSAKVAPDWSPDGRMIVYGSNQGGDWNIWSVPASGGEARRLTTHPGDEWNPRYSPDGRSILFSTNWGDNANIDVWMVPAEGGEPIRLTAGLEDEVTPAWSPDGRRIAFWTDLGGLFVMDLASGERTHIAPGEGFQDILSWSPDGQWIAVGRNPEPYRLFEISLDGGDPRPLGLREWNVWTPDVSRSSGAIAFAAWDRFENVDLWLLRDANVQPTRLTTDPAPDLHPAWSPSGDRIAFVSRRDGAHNGDIWVTPASGGTAVRMTSMRSAHRPRWCSERTIVFNSDRVADGQHHIWAITPGEAARQLTRGPREVEPDCVPSTGEIIYVGSVGPGSELFRMPLIGGRATQLTNDGAWTRFPRASSDGSSIAFVSSRDGTQEIFVMPISGGPARRLTNDGGQKSPPAWSSDGKRIVYSVKPGVSQIRRYSVPLR